MGESILYPPFPIHLPLSALSPGGQLQPMESMGQRFWEGENVKSDYSPWDRPFGVTVNCPNPLPEGHCLPFLNSSNSPSSNPSPCSIRPRKVYPDFSRVQGTLTPPTPFTEFSCNRPPCHVLALGILTDASGKTTDVHYTSKKCSFYCISSLNQHLTK